ncbi:MAG: ABC transporter ATP-binding protein [Desulfobacterales bacterium]|nr:ABC transporter ATP-binding protein [Desulfobacterales bacterium]
MRTDFGYFEEKQLGKPYDMKMLKRLYPFTRPYRLLVSGSIMLVVLIAFLDLSLPYVTKMAIDRYIVPQSASDMADASGSEIRNLKVNVLEPETREIISRYPDIFQISGQEAVIELKNLSQLSKNDLTELRKKDFNGLNIITAVFICIIIFSFVFNFLQVILMEYTGQMIMHDLRMRLFKHIQELSVSFFTKNPVGRLVTRTTNDIQNMHDLFTSVISFVFKDLFLLTGITLALLWINWKLALVSFSVLPFVVFASMYFSTSARDAFRTLRIKIAEINTRFAETIEGIKILQIFLHERENYLSFKKLNHEHYMASMQQIHVFAIFMPVIELLGSIALAVVIYYGGGSMLAGKISLGSLVAFISYLKMFFRPIRDIAEKYNILQNAMASAERIFLILDNQEKIQQPVADSGYKTPDLKKIQNIVMENVSFGYTEDEPVLKNISLEIHAGETIAIVGRTGSGKTSLINLILRFYDPTSGKITINGINIKDFELSSLRSKTAMIMQDPFLFSGTILDNIIQGQNNISRQNMEFILEASNCKKIIERLPDGLNTLLYEGGTSLSSGERQLISMARAFARNPDLIILDEATSYVDSETEEKVRQALYSLIKKRTSIIVAHRLSTVRHADRIMVINKGRIIETGTHDELMKKKGFYFKLNQLQLS